MPKIKRISSNAMAKKFSGKYAGHSDAKKKTVYVDNALSKKAQGVVIDHETGHVSKGESEGFGIPAAIIGASLVSGYLGDKAAGKQAKVGKSQIRESGRQFDLTRADTASQRELGENAIAQMMQGGPVTPEMMGPGYDFRMGQGEQALANYLGKTGMKRSGRGMKEMTRFGQGFASNEYSNYMSRLMQQAGLGIQGVSTSAGAGARMAGSPGYGTMAQAAGGGPQAWNQAIQGGMSNYFAYKQQQDMMNLLQPQGGG